MCYRIMSLTDQSDRWQIRAVYKRERADGSCWSGSDPSSHSKSNPDLLFQARSKEHLGPPLRDIRIFGFTGAAISFRPTLH